MKKLLLLIGFGLFAYSASLSAQTCSHANKTAEAKTCVKPSEAALKAASMDASIETKVCEKSGKVCFLKKTTDAQGATTSTEVRYDEAQAQFVSITDADGKPKTCSSAKACCAKGGKGKACCKSKSTASVAAHENVAPAQQPKSE